MCYPKKLQGTFSRAVRGDMNTFKLTIEHNYLRIAPQVSRLNAIASNGSLRTWVSNPRNLCTHTEVSGYIYSGPHTQSPQHTNKNSGAGQLSCTLTTARRFNCVSIFGLYSLCCLFVHLRILVVVRIQTNLHLLSLPWLPSWSWKPGPSHLHFVSSCLQRPFTCLCQRSSHKI